MLSLLTGSLGTILGYLQKERHQVTQDHQEALTALVVALTETIAYLKRWKCTQQDDPVIEGRLSALWNAASIPVEKIDEMLAIYCRDKARYWSHPAEWSEDELNNGAIKLENMAELITKVLGDEIIDKYIPDRRTLHYLDQQDEMP